MNRSFPGKEEGRRTLQEVVTAQNTSIKSWLRTIPVKFKFSPSLNDFPFWSPHSPQDMGLIWANSNCRQGPFETPCDKS